MQLKFNKLLTFILCVFLFPNLSQASDQYHFVVTDTGHQSLPVRLESFNLTLVNNNEVLVEWVTAEQWTNVRYEIQRSSNNAGFISVGFLTLLSNVDPQKNFSFDDFLNDQELKESQWYYRIKQIDDKGNVSYSYVRVLKLKNDEDEVTSVYPNPSFGEFNINVFSIAKADVSVIFYDMNGNIALQRTYSINGQQNITLDEVRQLKKGMYMLQVIFGHRKTISQRFIKQ
jgi:Secretion system C-terminal sorting domain